MNTCSKKRLIPQIVNNLDSDNFFDSNNFFTLPNTLDDESFIHIIQHNTCLHNIQDLDPEDVAERLRIKKKQADKRRMRRIRWEAEIQAGKVKRLRRESRTAHKRSRTEDGVLGIVWWNQEYWGTGFGVKRLGIKKEEPSTPSLVKVEHPPTPPLTYPPSRTSMSRFHSIDPNKFVWSPVYWPSPFEFIIISCSKFGHLASASVSPFCATSQETQIKNLWAFGIYWYKPLLLGKTSKQKYFDKNGY